MLGLNTKKSLKRRNLTLRMYYFYKVKVFKIIFDFIIESSMWVALSVVSLTFITYKNLSVEIDIIVLALSFFSTVFGYNFIKFFEKDQLNNFSVRSVKVQFKKLKTVQKLNLLFSLFSLLFSLCCFLQLKSFTQLFLILPAALTFFYTNPFKNKTIRSVSGVKIFVIALSWVSVTIGFPVIEGEIELNSSVYIEAIQRFLFVIAITLPFEIRDLESDAEYLKTIPQVVGIKKTKFIGLVLLISFLLLEFCKDVILERNLITVPLVFLISLLAVALSKKKQAIYYSSFWVEGIPVFWAILILFI